MHDYSFLKKEIKHPCIDTQLKHIYLLDHAHPQYQQTVSTSSLSYREPELVDRTLTTWQPGRGMLLQWLVTPIVSTV